MINNLDKQPILKHHDFDKYLNQQPLYSVDYQKLLQLLYNSCLEEEFSVYLQKNMIFDLHWVSKKRNILKINVLNQNAINNCYLLNFFVNDNQLLKYNHQTKDLEIISLVWYAKNYYDNYNFPYEIRFTKNPSQKLINNIIKEIKEHQKEVYHFDFDIKTKQQWLNWYSNHFHVINALDPIEIANDYVLFNMLQQQKISNNYVDNFVFITKDENDDIERFYYVNDMMLTPFIKDFLLNFKLDNMIDEIIIKNQ